ncbi:MAG TPA: hypothetical protein VJM08_07390 [Anaerolineales bacterium]|nr:hypothetical protein [Anaerolineales bacterium]
MKAKSIKVYLEIGKKRTFAGAIEWPGWCRSGRDEESALQALVDYGSRYAHLLGTNDFGFQAPTNPSVFSIAERLEGNATTDFGAPSMAPSRDADRIDDDELQRFQSLLKTFWRAFDRATKSARGNELRKGPRGGGREVEGIIQHVLESDAGYLSALGWKVKLDESVESGQMRKRIRKSMLEALTAGAHGEVAARGSRGGIRWTPRYFVRRVAWHVLDHVWEIEDRII